MSLYIPPHVSGYISEYLGTGIHTRAVSSEDTQKLISDYFAAVESPTSDAESIKSSPEQSRKLSEYLVSVHIKKEQVDPIIHACDRLFGRSMQQLCLLTGGRGTSKILKFSIIDKEYVCRVVDSNRPAFFNKTVSEVYNMKIVNQLNLTPKVHFSDEQTGIMIMDYVHNIFLTTQILKDEEHSEPLYTQFAKSLHALHSGPRFAEESTNIFTDVAVTAKGGDFKLMPSDALDILNTMSSLESVLKKHQTTAPCHKELNGNNVLFDGKKIYFIDWEGSGNCDPFVDLAIASIFFIFSEEKEDHFLKSYFGTAPTKEQKAHLYLMKQICLCFYMFKSLRRVTGSARIDLSKEQVNLESLQSYKDFVLEFFNGCSKVCTIDDFKTFTYVFLREVKKNIDSPRFKEAIEILSK